jgi:hypothetical protein
MGRARQKLPFPPPSGHRNFGLLLRTRPQRFTIFSEFAPIFI